jgi:hypothetical protein
MSNTIQGVSAARLAEIVLEVRDKSVRELVASGFTQEQSEREIERQLNELAWRMGTEPMQ